MYGRNRRPKENGSPRSQKTSDFHFQDKNVGPFLFRIYQEFRPKCNANSAQFSRGKGGGWDRIVRNWTEKEEFAQRKRNGFVLDQQKSTT